MEQAFFVRVSFNNVSLQLRPFDSITIDLNNRVNSVSDNHIRKKGTG